jgi:hypothetical protein
MSTPPLASETKPPRPAAPEVCTENIPTALRERNQWVAWRYEWRAKEERWAKVPISPRTGRYASSTDPATWTSFGEALGYHRNSRQATDGIGFVFSAADPFAGIDLDRAIDPATGEIRPWALRIIEEMATYAELSPSRQGVKLWLVGRLPAGIRKKVAYEGGGIEVYEAGRYFTCTGLRWPGSPATVEPRQEVLDALCDRLLRAAKQTRGGGGAAPAGPPGDAEVLAVAARCSPKFDRLWRGDTSGHNGDDSAADLALCDLLAYFGGPDPALIDRLFRQSGLMRAKWDQRRGEQTYGQRTVATALGGRTQFYDWARHHGGGGNGTAHTNGEATDRPEIVITTQEHEVNAQAADALGRDSSLFQRGGLLVRVVRDTSPAARGVRRPLAPRIEPLPPALLRERLAASARWFSLRETRDGLIRVDAHPPAWCVSAVHARADWPGIRRLDAVVDYPILRPDGTVLSASGYDPDTGLLLEMAGEPPTIPDAPTHTQAVAARDDLLEAVADFPFASEAHRSAWLASVLTPLARFAFPGPAPLFLVDANVRGAGKGLLLDCTCRILTGERFTVATYTADEDELRKRITSLALAGDRLVLFDNLEGRFGNATLDAALTATSWEDRVLGVNRMTRAPLFVTWYATGNNVAVGADTARRLCHVRLESPEERPEERSGFRHPDLLGYVAGRRRQLLGAALTILRAYWVAGRPDQGLIPWGSFDGWSRLVRSAVVWVWLPDPGLTRVQLQEQSDTTAEGMALLLRCWERMDAERRGLTAGEVIDRLYRHPPEAPPDWHAEMRDAIEALVGRGDSRALGTRLRSYRRRIFGGRFIDRAGQQRRAARWAVYPAAEFRARREDTHHTHHTHPGAPDPPPCGGECGECGECGSPGAAAAAGGSDTGGGAVATNQEQSPDEFTETELDDSRSPWPLAAETAHASRTVAPGGGLS